ncbi:MULTISPECIES: hypothetical protein [Mycobacterium]|uniref:hypothetical protein n=1 Tax=Mycobacterium TaxID=1763 RepID=UPI0010581AC1|nr:MULTISPECIES: hypothetical protein [Mycobacterium]MDM4141390.1 hypothetical protein [Mycobacterium sp. FLAC0960]
MPNNTFPIPAGALRVYEWQLGPTGPDGAPNVSRRFVGGSWGSDRLTVSVDGIQQGDGSCERYIYVDVGDAELSSKEARRLACALTAAVEDVERLHEVDGASK